MKGPIKKEKLAEGFQEVLQVAHPPVKWAGGKRQLLSTILPLVPKTFNRYVEPFVGGGAVFFALRAKLGLELDATLSDANGHLVCAYGAIKHDVERVIRELRAMERLYKQRGEEYYYVVRNRLPPTTSMYAAASWLLFLNKTCFNGLWRVNSRGFFNVPCGRYENPPICDEENLRNCSRALQGVPIARFDFEGVSPDKGDFVYFDPPYAPIDENSFVKYSASGFGKEDQERLARHYEWLSARKVKVLLSNSDTPFVRKLYSRFEIIPVKARRAINSNASGRGAVGEVLVKNY